MRSADDPAEAVASAIDQMFERDGYEERIAQHHEGLLWSGLDGVAFSRQYRLHPIEPGSDIWSRASGGFEGSSRGAQGVYCVDAPQEGFTDGRPDVMNTFSDPDCAEGTCRQEGWVEVTPYWSDEPIKICAYDAQDFEFALDGVTSCNDRDPGNDAGCGCGENLNRCWTPWMVDELNNQLIREGGHIMSYFATGGRDYLEAFTTNRTVMNGPIAHYYREMGHVDEGAGVTTAEGVVFNADVGEVPSIPYAATETWEVVERGASHAGPFTTAGYLMRFGSNRGRANRFYSAFYCDPFLPSAEGLPPEEPDPSPNLRERAGCRDCHESLEPAAAHFARWRTVGDHGLLAEDQMSFDTPREVCQCGEGTSRPSCSGFCSRYYVTADNSHPETYDIYGGLPLEMIYSSDADRDAAEVGPAALVDEPNERRAVAECATRNMVEALLHRPVAVDDLSWVEGMTDEFEASGYDFSQMVRMIIKDERYLGTR